MTKSCYAHATLLLTTLLRSANGQTGNTYQPGFFYPDWAGGSKTCINKNTTAPSNYLFIVVTGYLELTLESCLDRYYPAILSEDYLLQTGESSPVTDCFNSYVPGASYSDGDQVSTTTDCTFNVGCTVGDTGCGSDGLSAVTVKFSSNYRCNVGSSAICSQDDDEFNPEVSCDRRPHLNSAWKELAPCGLTDDIVPALSPTINGCFNAYVSGASYSAGDWVSATTTCTEKVSCAVGTAGCGSDGTITVTQNEKYNYRCNDGPSSAFCNQGGFAPGGSCVGTSYWTSAWTEEDEQCTGSTPASELLPDLWSGSGCPQSEDAIRAQNDSGQFYAGDIVSVVKTEYTAVYQCAEEPTNQFCGMAGFEPGVGQFWSTAWTLLGRCEGTLSPTKTPSYDFLADDGGCQYEFAGARGGYEEGDRVFVSSDPSDSLLGGLVYQCKAWPLGAHCNQAGYEPGTFTGTRDQKVELWKIAWTVVGFCDGTNSPTSSPAFGGSFGVLPNMGGCPGNWVSQTYEEGDLISVGGSDGKLVYQCQVWPQSLHCGQAGYEPDTNPSAPNAWRDVWTVVGFCAGPTVPTASPVFDRLSSSGACPELWSASRTSYEEGDRVAYAVSDGPTRSIIYECRTWPNSGYCNQGAGFEPTTQYGGAAWTLVGSCDGSFAPTRSPAAYDGDNCQYSRCVMEESTVSCSPGSTSCGCSSPVPAASPTCVKKVENVECNAAPVNLWNSGTTYVTDDVVRVGLKRYKCREWPNFFWCRMSAYKPTGNRVGIWTHAWRADGTCPDDDDA